MWTKIVHPRADVGDLVDVVTEIEGVVEEVQAEECLGRSCGPGLGIGVVAPGRGRACCSSEYGLQRP